MILLSVLVLLSALFSVSDATESVAFYFRAEPQDTWVALGNNLTLSCGTSTTVDKTWTWTLHSDTGDNTGTVLAETSNTLVYGPATMALNSKFISCSADVFGTKLISRYAIIRVSYLEENFLEQPEDVTVESGSYHVRLNCNPPVGRPEPYVTWQKDGEEVDKANTYVDPLGGLNILNVGNSWGGSYTCTAHSYQDHPNVISRAATLTVAGSTVADTLSVSYDVSFAKSRYKISARSGDSVRVLCGFLGNPTPAFTLMLGSTEITNSASQEVGNFGTWANVHDISNVSEFQCEGLNSAGGQTLNIVIEITGSLQVAGGMEVNILEEEGTTLVCSETGASEEPNYSWYLNGAVLAGETEKYLEIVDADRSQSGMYQCFAATSFAKEHATFAVTVQGIEAVPVKVTVISDEYGLLGESLQLSCIGQGNPVPSVSWHRKEDNSETAISLDEIVYKETFTEILAVLNMESLVEQDDGVEYICKGSNQDLYNEAVDYSAESSITLSVVQAIHPIISLPSTSSMTAGTRLTLICSVDGSPPPLIEWFKNGVKIEGESEEKYITSGDSGIYTCTATNMLGTVTHDVIVQSKPEFSGAEIFLLLLIAGFVLLVLVVGLLIVIRRNELDRRVKEARAKDELLIENDLKRSDVLPLATHPYLVTPTPEVVPYTPAEGDPEVLATTPTVGEPPAVSEAECQTPRSNVINITPRPNTPQPQQIPV